MIQKLESILIICVMVGSVALTTMPAHVEGSTAPMDPYEPPPGDPDPTNNPPNTPSKPNGPTSMNTDACFLAGTQITMADGSHKNIKQVEPGDMVKSFDNGNVVNGEVVRVYKHTPGEMTDYYLVINDNLRVIPNHIIYVNGGWMPAGDIEVGYKLLGLDGGYVTVTSVEEVWERVPTYNLEIDTYHTFFASGVLVHNSKVGLYEYTTSTTDPDGDSVKYYFDWDDGSGTWTWYYDSGATAHAYHSWANPGTYHVRVKAKDENGDVSGWSASLEVKVNSRPTADFSYSPSSPDTEGYIYFSDQSTDTDGHIASRNWDFGDGSYGSGISPQHRYDSAGTYTVTLTVEDNMGAADVASKSIGVTGVIKVAVYNVSELEKDGYSDTRGSEDWAYTGTAGMEKSLDGYEFDKDGKTYRFEADVLEYPSIANGALQTGNYNLLLAPGDDDYFTDPYTPSGVGLKSKIVDFVDSGGGYIGTCGGAEFACKGIRYSDVEDSGLITLGIIDAYAYESYSMINSSRAYYYKSIMYGNGTTEDGNGSGVSDWGGIPMVNNFTYNAPAPFENYSLNTKTLQYWGGPWFESAGNNFIGIARYNKEPGDEPTTKLHYKLDGGNVRNVTTHIEGKWSIIEQDSVGGSGRVVLFGCHPEHMTWGWGDGQVIESSDYKSYIYCFPLTASSWNEMQSPRYDTYDVIQDCAKWTVEDIL